jgi:hypothetical protein
MNIVTLLLLLETYAKFYYLLIFKKIDQIIIK